MRTTTPAATGNRSFVRRGESLFRLTGFLPVNTDRRRRDLVGYVLGEVQASSDRAKGRGSRFPVVTGRKLVEESGLYRSERCVSSDVIASSTRSAVMNLREDEVYGPSEEESNPRGESSGSE